MSDRGLPLLLLAFIFSLVAPGPAAPVPGTAGSALTKMYPRGNHWAVGHLMGKKSTEESPSNHQSGNLKQQLLEYIRCQEAVRNMLKLREAKGIQGYQSPSQESLSSRQYTWGSEENRHLKDVGSRHKVQRGVSSVHPLLGIFTASDSQVGRLFAPGSQHEERKPQLK